MVKEEIKEGEDQEKKGIMGGGNQRWVIKKKGNQGKRDQEKRKSRERG